MEQELDKILQKENDRNKIRRKQSRRRYEQFLEEQKKHSERNKKLMEMLERIDQQAVALSARTEQLKKMKLQYEMYVSQLVHNQSMRILQTSSQPHGGMSIPVLVPTAVPPTMPLPAFASATAANETNAHTQQVHGPEVDPRQIAPTISTVSTATPCQWALAMATPFSAGMFLMPANTTAVPPMPESPFTRHYTPMNAFPNKFAQWGPPHDHLAQRKDERNTTPTELTNESVRSAANVSTLTRKSTDNDLGQKRSALFDEELAGLAEKADPAHEESSKISTGMGENHDFEQEPDFNTKQKDSHFDDQPRAYTQPNEVSESIGALPMNNKFQPSDNQAEQNVNFDFKNIDFRNESQEYIEEEENIKVPILEEIETKLADMDISENAGDPKMNIENIENAIYGELVSPLEDTKYRNEHIPETKQLSADVAPPNVEQLEESEHFMPIIQNNSDLASSTMAYSQETRDPVDDYNYEPTLVTTEAELYPQRTLEETHNNKSVSNVIDAPQYENESNTGLGKELAYENIDYSNYDTSQYEGVYDENTAYPGYTYDEATGQYTANDPTQFAEPNSGADFDYASQGVEYSDTQALTNYDFGAYSETAEPTFTDNRDETVAVTEETAQVFTAEEPAPQESAVEVSDINTENVPTSNAPKKTVKPILSTPSGSASNEAQKKKKRVNFVNSSDTDDSSRTAKSSGGNQEAIGGSSESDFDFSAGESAELQDSETKQSL